MTTSTCSRSRQWSVRSRVGTSHIPRTGRCGKRDVTVRVQVGPLYSICNVPCPVTNTRGWTGVPVPPRPLLASLTNTLSTRVVCACACALHLHNSPCHPSPSVTNTLKPFTNYVYLTVTVPKINIERCNY